MRFLSILFFSLLTLLFFAIPSTAQRGRDVEKFDKTDSTRGLVIFSISTTKPILSIYYLDIFHFESRKKARFALGTFQLADVKNDSAKVHYFATKLPRGHYKIFGWGLVSNGIGGSTITPRGNFNLPFTVSGGSINYLGDYLGSAVYGKGINVLKGPQGGYFIVSNRYEEDYKAIAEKWPSLDLTGILNAMPDFSENKPMRSLMYLKGINIP